ncbi:MAG: hypothetical protein WB586_13070 [Chthoniobacterales bacterium]
MISNATKRSIYRSSTQKLNQVADLQGNDVWGRSDNCGGSPRERGSALCPHDLSKLIEDFQCGTTLAYWLLKRGFEPVENWVCANLAPRHPFQYV